MSEANDLQKFIVSYLKAQGWTVWRNNSGQIRTSSYIVRLSPPGIGDVIGFDPRGAFVNIEVKIDEDVISLKQVDVLATIAASPYGIACVARTEKQFLQWFRDCKKTV